MTALQLSLLEPEATAPDGFAYRPELISTTEERELIAGFATLPFREFEFHGFYGKRRTVSYGLRYDFADMKMHRVEPIPDFLLPLRAQAAAFAGLDPEAIEHALVTEYGAGAAIGWHRDRPVFGDVIGISFASACRFRFRRRRDPHPDPPPQAGEGRVGASRISGWERLAVTLEPRSVYLLRGSARHQWEHSIPPAEALRYSVTLRTMRAR